jgi:hypothetical protein
MRLSLSCVQSPHTQDVERRPDQGLTGNSNGSVMPKQRQEEENHEATHTQESHPLEMQTPMLIEIGAAFSGAGEMQIRWLDAVEEALRKLRPQVEAALIDNAEAELKVVRVDPAAPQAWNRLKMSIGKIVERLAINAGNEAIHEGIHELIKLLF